MTLLFARFTPGKNPIPGFQPRTIKPVARSLCWLRHRSLPRFSLCHLIHVFIGKDPSYAVITEYSHAAPLPSGLSSIVFSLNLWSDYNIGYWINTFLVVFSKLQKRLLAPSCLSDRPSARPHGLLPMDGFSWSLILGYFFENLSRNSNFIKNGLYMMIVHISDNITFSSS